ncbi:MAG: 3,4-dihydroxy-2-butanone-4-phosphate synthase [Planctomycetota bacterium]
MPARFSTVEAAVAAFGRGEIVIVADDEDRENEGDFVCAAELATTETVNFILNGRGEFCVAVLPEVCQRLGLSPLVDTNTAPLGTGFMTPIDHRSVKTGITAEERALTVRAIANSSTVARDFVRPGHVHPLLAKEGGVLRRAGHTEATVDLVRMAGCSPAGVLGEILNSAGERATPRELFALAAQHNLKIITLEQLIRHRRVSEKLVSRVAEAKLPTRYGNFQIVVYQVRYEEQQPMALVFGNPAEAAAPLVRLHSSCFTGDLVESLRCDCGDQFHEALEMISSAGAGALIYLPQEGRVIGLVEKIKAYALQEQGQDSVEAYLALGDTAVRRD